MLSVKDDFYRKSKLCGKTSHFRSIGKNVRLPAMRLPLYPELVTFGVSFITHDAIHGVLNCCTEQIEGGYPEEKYQIEIFVNVFVGANSIMCGNVQIGPNAVVGAGSVVNKDVPEGCVYAGVPARKVGSFSDLVNKRKRKNNT